MIEDPPRTGAESVTDTDTETELKLVVPTERLETLRQAIERGESRTVRLEAVYFDTPDDALAARAIALRIRKEGKRWVQTAKAVTSADVWRRLEHNAPREAAPGGAAPVFELALHDGTPVGRAIRAALDPAAADGGLVARFRTEVSRTTRLEELDGAVLELALDIGRVVAGDRSDAVCELEVELKSGPVQALFATAGAWMLAHGLWLGTSTKAERGERLLHGLSHGEPVHAAPPVIDARAGPRRFVQSVLAACAAQVLGNASEVAAGSPDEETVHQLRVGLRRLRTALRELGSGVDGVDPGWEPVFRDTFQALGVHRDAVTVSAKLGDMLLAAGLADPVRPADTGAAADLGTIVRGTAFQQAILGVMAFCQPAEGDAAPRRRHARRRLKRQLAARLDRLHAALCRDASRFSALPAARQHRIRKRLKRLRYLAEFTAPLFGTRPVARFLKRWRAAQDALGEHNDLWVGLDLLRASTPPGASRRRAVRWVREQLRDSAARCERRLRQAAKKKGFWTRPSE